MDFRQNGELTVRDLLVIYRKRRQTIFGTMLFLAILCGVYCAVSTRRYEATGIVQIQNENSDALGLDNLTSESASAGGALDTNISIQTQANILQSDTLALRTIENLHMEQTQDFRPHWSPIGWLFGLISPRGTPDPVAVPLENAPNRRAHALAVFAKNLTVKPISGTRLLEISYLNPDPKLAADVVNELTQGLMDYTFQTRFNATTQASTWLTGQLGELRKQSEDLQSKVVDLQRESGVYSLGTVDSQGREQAYSGVLDRLQQATVAMTQAQQNRILKGAIEQAAESGDAEMLSGLAGNSGGGTANNSLLLLQNLRQQEATERAALQEAEAKYGPSYPKLNEIRGNLAGIERSIQDEIARIKERAKSDYDVAVQAEANTRQQYEQAKEQADKLNDKAIEYAMMREEADESRGLYEDLLKRLKEAGVLEGLKSSNITIVDPGRPPARPKKPNVPIYMAISLAAGFFLGCIAALLVDSLDNKIGGIAEVEQLTGQNLLGATPLFTPVAHTQTYDGNSHLTSLDEPQSTYAEAIRSIRTAVLLTGGGNKSKVLLVTSSIPAEGKTTFAANMAAIMSQSNRKVLLVDMDLRRGTLRHRLNLSAGPGLSEILAGQELSVPVRKIEGAPNLDILLAGTPPPNPSELLDNKIAGLIEGWRNTYDYVVLDGAPLLPVTDSVIVSPLVDVTLLLARSGLTERPQLQRSYRLMAQNTRHFVGVILNGLRPEDESYYGYYGYRKYSYHYGEDGNAKTR